MALAASNATVTITANGAANLIDTAYGINLRASLVLHTPLLTDALNILCGVGATDKGSFEGALTKTGLGTVTLAGAGTHTGGTLVKAGTLVVVTVRCRAQTTPANAPGSAVMMMNGSSQLWKLTTSSR